MKRLATALVIVMMILSTSVCLGQGTTVRATSPTAKEVKTSAIPMTATIQPDLSLWYQINEVPADSIQPWGPGSRPDVSSMNFFQLKRNTQYGWYSSDVYFTVFLVASATGRPYTIKQNCSQFKTASNVNLSKSIIFTPQYCQDDLWKYGTTSVKQGPLPSDGTLGDDASTKLIPTTVVNTGLWRVAADGTDHIVYKSTGGKPAMVRAVYGIFTADPAAKAIHGAWPAGIATNTNGEPTEGLITDATLAGLTGAETVSGSVTFTVTTP